MKNFQKAIAVIALSGMCLAAPVPSDSDVAAKKAKKHAHKTEAAAPACAACQDIKQLKDQVAAQQAEIDQLKNARPAAAVPDAAAAAAAAAAQKQAADAAAAAAEANAKANAAQGEVAGIKSEVNANSQEVEQEKKKVDYLEHPASIAYKGIRITPAGFFEATGFYRSAAMLSDQATQFQSIPLEHNANNNALANTESGYNPNLSEFAFTPRDSRIAFRIDADPTKSVKLAGYFEMDFLGAASTANTNQTSSYTPRIRQAWARAKFSNGFTITGGQMWSLITLNRKGTDADNSNVWIPNIIEAQYSVGYDWGRFAAIRLSQTMGKNVAVAFELTNPTSLTQANNTTTGIAGVASAGNGLDGNSLCTASAAGAVCTVTPTYSTNMAPDMIGKISFDSAKAGHFEVKGVGRFFRDRVLPTEVAGVVTPGWNNTDLGWGVGAGGVVPVVSKKVDFIFQGLYGKGISRYQDAGQYDFVIHTLAASEPASSQTYNLIPIKALSVLAGFETHPTKKTELDVIFGEEYYFRTEYITDPTAVAAGKAATYGGYGPQTANNAGCFAELNSQAPVVAGTTAACSPNNRVVWNGKIYGYYDLFRGPHGTLRYGAEYDYDYRNTWSGNSNGTLAKGLTPIGHDNIGFVTMRYILP